MPTTSEDDKGQQPRRGDQDAHPPVDTIEWVDFGGLDLYSSLTQIAPDHGKAGPSRRVGDSRHRPTLQLHNRAPRQGGGDCIAHDSPCRVEACEAESPAQALAGAAQALVEGEVLAHHAATEITSAQDQEGQSRSSEGYT